MVTNNLAFECIYLILNFSTLLLSTSQPQPHLPPRPHVVMFLEMLDSFFLCPPPPLPCSAFLPYSYLSLRWPSTPLIGPSGHLLCFLSFVLLPSGVTGNPHTWECTSQSPCSVLISINYVLVLDFVSLEPTHPLVSQQSLALTNENLGFQIYFP